MRGEALKVPLKRKIMCFFVGRKLEKTSNQAFYGTVFFALKSLEICQSSVFSLLLINSLSSLFQFLGRSLRNYSYSG